MNKLIFQNPTPGTEKSGGHYELRLDRPAIMGILNVTPDSFSDGDRYLELESALSHAKKMLQEGATIIDVGGESTRPGSSPISEEEEIHRVVPVIESLASESTAIISIDSYKPAVVEEALAAGAHMVNDISGGRNKGMFRICAEYGVPLVLMHMQGDPLSMQDKPSYDHVVREVSDFLIMQAVKAKRAGVQSVVVDPGIGFGKSLEDNLRLIRNLRVLSKDLYPLLLGASRKSLIQRIEGFESSPQDRDSGSVAMHIFGIMHGASIIRVHNVAAHSQALKVWETLNLMKEND